MRTVITYCLLFLFSLAFSYETIAYLSAKLNDGFQLAVTDYEVENDTEADDEQEKKESLEDFYFLEKHDLQCVSQMHSAQFTDFIFSSSDYSQTIYSPPEQAKL